MKTKRLAPAAGSETHVLVFETGDEVMQGLTDYARRENLRAGHFTAIGAFRSAELAYFEWETKTYAKIPVAEQVEVLVLAGDVAWKDNEPAVHAHVVLGRRDGSTRGGHLVSGIVRPTLEVALTIGGSLEKRFDPATGLSFITDQ